VTYAPADGATLRTLSACADAGPASGITADTDPSTAATTALLAPARTCPTVSCPSRPGNRGSTRIGWSFLAETALEPRCEVREVTFPGARTARDAALRG
jgi:hypothetical protein